MFIIGHFQRFRLTNVEISSMFLFLEDIMPELPTGAILAVDDDADVLLSLRLLLKPQFDEIITETDPNRILAHLRARDFDIILLDMNFTRDTSEGREGFDWLARILEFDPEAVVVFLTAYGDVEKAVRAIRAGAADFVEKPWKNEKLLATLSAARQLRHSRRETTLLRQRQAILQDSLDQPFHDMVGDSPAMQRIYEIIRQVGPTDANVLILGENGTGKELVARALHRCSRRRDEMFMSVDLGAVTETLFESELFGCVKGAFTDARRDRPGRFEVAAGGTLFLDEIGNLNLTQQAKLLTSIEKREITRVGSERPTPIDVRLICATNKPLDELRRENIFRRDLLYRINTVEIDLPPLRERTEDIPLLAETFLHTFGRKYNRPGLHLDSSAQTRLQGYPWPGNIRELQHALERAVILATGDQIAAAAFDFLAPNQTPTPTGKTLTEMERATLIETLRQHNGNISHAAKALGITRASLYRRMEKYGL